MARRGAWAPAIAAVLVVAALQVHRLDDHDTWWHLASGRLIAASGEVARTDPFSTSAADVPWINRQWLFDAGAYATWKMGGATGVALATGALFLTAFVGLFALARRRLPAWAAAGLVVLAALTAVERFVARPEAVTFCLLAAVLFLSSGPLTPIRTGALVLLQVLWANCHALSVLGVVVLGAELICAVTTPRLGWPTGKRTPAEVRLLAIALAGALVAEAVTPFGIAGALFPLRLFDVLRGAEVTSATVIEHRPPVLAELTTPVAYGAGALLGLAAWATLRAWHHARLASVVIAFAFIALAGMARRNVGLLGIGVLPLVAEALSPLARRANMRPRLRRVLDATVVALCALLVARIVSNRFYVDARLSRSFGLGVSAQLFPSAAVDFLGAAAPPAPFFNADTLGGLVLWRTYPPRRVFIDGRLQVYPGSVFREYVEAVDDPTTFAALAARYGFGAAIVYHTTAGQMELAAAIARLPGWRLAFLDPASAVLVADGQPAGRPGGLSDRIDTEQSGVAGWLDRLLRPVQVHAEEATVRYHRGRAALTLLGAAGATAARADFEASLVLWPEFPDARLGLGYALFLAGDRAGARAAWQRLLVEHPGFQPAATALAAVPSP